ncbi:PIG-L deacetylase family protein [Chelatococcus sp. GCM10030263]|uniref:PIG-L deacetylase family protein n=1 Tax=Chelatococcus sp. GCM10030263 TaxID=3273387 RepID=UPI00360E5386
MVDFLSLAGGVVLFVFPHPDDDVFVGGTLSLLVRAGVRVEAAWMTSGGYDGLDEVREAELQHAMEVVGVCERHLLRQPDGGLVGTLEESCGALRRLIEELRPQAVVAPAFEGGHADHDATNFAIAEACRRARSDARLFEYPCYAPDGEAPEGLRLGAFPAGAVGVRRVDLDAAAMRCKLSMVEAYVSQQAVFDLLGWRASATEFFREIPKSRDHRRPPAAGLDSYAHWFNRRSPDRFGQLAAAVDASITAAGQPMPCR